MTTPPSTRPPVRLGTLLLGSMLAASVFALGCATGNDDDAGMGTPDTGPRRDAGRDGGSMMMADAFVPPTDAGGMDTDADTTGVECGGVACAAFQYCDAGACRDYPACRGDGTCDRPADVCHNRRCVPMDVDIDGDGYPAGEDCDETDPDKNPGETEICNGVDDDCNDMVDDGDPAALCEFYPGGGECMAGSCGCDPGEFDIDRSVPGCECVAVPGIDEGLGCATAIDIGDVADNGQVESVSGNVMPDDREVWYRFRGVDGADTTCDNLHVRAQFTQNPDDTFELTVFRGTCDDTAACDDTGFTDYNWATDFRETIDGRLTGQCPCTDPAGATVTDMSVCSDDSADYFVRVRRRAGSVLSCDAFSIEISNGLYDTVP